MLYPTELRGLFLHLQCLGSGSQLLCGTRRHRSVTAGCLALRPGRESVTVTAMAKTAARAELPRYVGYAEIAEATGIDKRQIQREMARGKFPKPDALPTKENRWRLSVVLAWLEQRNAEQIANLSDLAVTDPAKLKPEQLGDALQALGARLASLHGQQIAADDVVGITYKLSDEQRAAIAHNAAAEQRELIEESLKRLEAMHSIEALLLVRSFLPQLAPFADSLLKHMNLDIYMSKEDWAEIGWRLVDRIVNGETLPEQMRPRDMVEALADDGVLSRK